MSDALLVTLTGEGELPLGRIDPVNLSWRALLDDEVRKSAIAASHVQPALSGLSVQTRNKLLSGKTRPDAHRAFICLAVAKGDIRLSQVRLQPLLAVAVVLG